MSVIGKVCKGTHRPPSLPFCHCKYASYKKLMHCGELVKQLTECHEKGWLHKFTGGCNGIKHELNMCLRDERLQRTARNREDSKLRNQKKHEAWKEIDEMR